MNRIQLIELHEQSWFPAFLRDEVTDTLRRGLDLTDAYASVLPLLQRALKETGALSVVDLCSGGGGPWLDLSSKLERRTDDLVIWLTDKYPNTTAFEDLQRCLKIGISFCKEAVDARNVPQSFDGFRTMFTSFHHFAPADAQAIVQSAVCARQGIGIFEVTRRSPSAIMLILVWSVASFFFTPLVRPFRWSRLLCTYLIPIIPFVLFFDGVVSCLRSYSVNELLLMVGRLDANGYKWDAGELRSSFGRVPIIYLIGIPEGLPCDSARQL